MRQNKIRKAAAGTMAAALAISMAVPTGVMAEQETQNPGGSVSENSAHYDTDTEAPEIVRIVMELEESNGNYGSGVLISVEAEDAGGAGLAEYPYSFNGCEWQSDNRWHTDENGTVIIRVRDRDGNETEESIGVTGIDKASPVISLSKQEEDNSAGPVKINIHAEDIESGVVRLMVKDEKGEEKIIQNYENGSTEADESVTIENDGDYEFYAEDAVGNITTQRIKVIHVVKEVPKEDENTEGKKEKDKEKEEDKKKEKDKGKEKDKEKNRDRENDNHGTITRPEIQVKQETTGRTGREGIAIVINASEKKEKKVYTEESPAKSSKIREKETYYDFDEEEDDNDNDLEENLEEDLPSESQNEVPFVSWEEYDSEALSENGISSDNGEEDYISSEEFALNKYMADQERSESGTDVKEMADTRKENAGLGMIMAGLIIMILTSVSTFILKKKGMIHLPSDSRGDSETA